MRVAKNCNFHRWKLQSTLYLYYATKWRIVDLPATTRLVPRNDSMSVECRTPKSAMVRDARRHSSVDKPSMNAPKYALTCGLSFYGILWSFKRWIFELIRNRTCKSAVQFSNARPSCVWANSNHQNICTKRYTQQPPMICAHVFNATTRTDVLPSSMSSMWWYGHAVASPHTLDHRIVKKNKHMA